MIRRTHSSPRAGVALIVVVSMLTLFAIAALGFVFYAESQSTVSRYSREAQQPLTADVDPELLLAYFLGQVIYDTDDPHSALRGHSLAASMYGPSTEYHPYGGYGKLGGNTTVGGFTLDNRHAINYTKFGGDTLRAPDKDFNLGYTYPDLNNLFLGAINGSGEVLIQSYHRSWTGVDFASTTGDQKYRTLRPHASYHPAFPQPADGGGDVKNFHGGPGLKNPAGGYFQNDSYWLDVGFPVLTAPDGRQYKPLFAPLIVSLDNRLNLLVSGNRQSDGTTTRHLSHHGLGRWEINLGKVITDDAIVQKLFTGLPKSRYGADGVPSANLTALPAPPPYSLFDFNGDTAQKVALPAQGENTIFPTFPATYKSGDASEVATHPARYSYRVPVGDDLSRPAMCNIEPLLRYGDTNSGSFSSDLAPLLGSKWHDPKVRNLVTLLSHSLDRPTWNPMFNQTNNDYKIRSGEIHPRMDPMIAPTTPSIPGGFSNQMEVRLDLNQPFPEYPAPAANGVIDLSDPTKKQAFDKALSARQTFANEVYSRLRAASGGIRPASDPSTESYKALRYLAQLAVNITDYIDPDTNSTPFAWNTNVPSDYVFGTELPQVVVNEVLCQLDNDSTDPDLNPVAAGTPRKASFYKLNTWIELYNPTKADVVLYRDKNAAFRVVLCKDDPGIAAHPLGEPPAILETINNWTGKEVIHAGDTKASNDPMKASYYVIGRQNLNLLPGRNPNITTYFDSTQIDRQYGPNDTIPAQIPANVTVVVQRLANPALALHENSSDTSKPYNPFITIDYLEGIPVNDNRVYDKNGSITPPPSLDSFKSKGRTQPFVARAPVDQSPSQVIANVPKHTMGVRNEPSHYDANNFKIKWLVHLDRQLLNIMELKHVSAFAPHLLTQKFYDGTNFFKHYAPWNAEDSLLFRALDLMTLKDRMVNNAVNGQVAGKINLSEVWDEEVFQALCDPQPGSGFTAADVTSVFNRLRASRENSASGLPDANSKPFLGFGAAAFSGANAPPNGLQSTLFRNDLSGAPLFKVSSATHPYFEDELLGKIVNNVTFTSNTFAVWCTVGFFEVTDTSVQPPRLGKEIGLAEARNVRHRFFAIIDRTEILKFSGKTTTAVSAGKDVKVYYDKNQVLSGDGQRMPVNGKAGVLLDFGAGRNDINSSDAHEVIMVKEVGTDSGGDYFTSDLQFDHPANSTFRCRGRPRGPWLRYDPKKDSSVVPYFNIIY
jgi:hypothetical protein